MKEWIMRKLKLRTQRNVVRAEFLRKLDQYITKLNTKPADMRCQYVKPNQKRS